MVGDRCRKNPRSEVPTSEGWMFVLKAQNLEFERLGAANVFCLIIFRGFISVFHHFLKIMLKSFLGGFDHFLVSAEIC